MLLEAFHAWKLMGAGGFDYLPARIVDAIVTLENELRTETRNGEE